MFDLDRWEEIWATISRNKMRSFFTAMGIFWGILMFVILSGAGLFLKRMVDAQVGSFATNASFFFTDITSKPYKGLNTGRWWSFENSDKDIIRDQVEGVENISGIIFGGNKPASRGEKSGSYNVIGHEPQYNLIEPQVILQGRFINDIDMIQNRKVCVIGHQIYEEMFQPGEVAVGQKLQIMGSYFTVVGVVTPSAEGVSIGGNARNRITMPFSTLQQMFNLGEKFGLLAVVGADNADLYVIEDNIKDILRSRHSIAPDDTKAVSAFNSKEVFDTFASLFTGLDLLTWFVGAGTLLAGVVGVSNIMLVVVRERTQEIGVKRALGASPRAIISQIMTESFVLTFIAGVAGLAIGVGILAIAENLINANRSIGMIQISPQLSFGVAITAMMVLVVGGVLAGIVPAERAMSVKPVDAIREE